MRFLIAGLGSIGRRHFRNLLALGEKDILLYRTHQSTLQDEELAGFRVETDLRKALEQKPDAVIVSNPTALHLDIAIPAAESGCHLFLEKPISHSLKRLDELQTAIQRGGGQVFVGFQFRFHPNLQHAKQLLSQGVIGRSLSARAHWGEYLPAWHPWEDYRSGYSARSDLGGGVILTLCHPLDYLRWLLGEIEAIWAFTEKMSDLELDVEDTAEIGLRFASGALGSVHLDYNQRPPEHHLEIIGTSGTLRWSYAEGLLSLYLADGHIQTAKAPNWSKYPVLPDFERNDMFLAEMRHFLKVIRGESESICTFEDGVQALRMALAAHHSAEQGKIVHLQAVNQESRTSS